MPDYAKSVNTKPPNPPIDTDEVLRRMLATPPKRHDEKQLSVPCKSENKKASEKK